MKNEDKLAIMNAALQDGDVFDNNTLHMLRVENGKVVEYKFCSRCKSWHPITDYSSCSNSKDGLQSYCKKCARLYNAARYKKSLKPAIIPVSKNEPSPVVEEPKRSENTYEQIEALLYSLKEEEAKREQEIKRLRASNEDLIEQSKDLSNLSESDIKRVLESKRITPRLLFEAVARLSGNRYFFYAFDKDTGMTIPIKLQENYLPISFQYEYGQIE